MADTSTKRSNYVTRVRQAVDQLLADVGALEQLTQEGIQLGYVALAGSTTAGSLQDADFTGENAFLSAATFAQVMSALQALDQAVHANSGAVLSSLYQIRR